MPSKFPSISTTIPLWESHVSFIFCWAWWFIWLEWTKTHQCTNMDGWCIDRIFFSILVPSQIDFFFCAFSTLILIYLFWQLYFSLPPTQFFSLCFIFGGALYFLPTCTQIIIIFWNFSLPPTHYPPLSPTNLLTYIFELKVDSSPSTYSPINLKCVTFIPAHLLTLPLTYIPTL